MSIDLGRLVRPLLATAGVAAALTATGCIGIVSDSAEQPDVIGDLAVTTEQCVASGIPPLRSEQRGGKPCFRIDTQGREGADLDVQLLIGYLVPESSTAPATIPASGLVEHEGPAQAQAGRGAPVEVDEREFTYTSSPAYGAELAARQDTPDGMKWVGYISDPQTAEDGDYAEWSTTARFKLPPTQAGQPFRGPYRYRTVVGYRSTNGNPARPVVCTEGTCIADSVPDAPRDRGTGAPLASASTRDLAVVPADGGPVSIAAGTGGDVPFVLRYAGASSPQPFRLTASTSLAGSPATPLAATFPATANQEGTVNVRVDVPAGAPLGLQRVELVAALPNGQHRRATAQFDVVAPAAPVTTTASQVIATPAKACASRRSFTIRLRQRRRDPLVSAVVRVNGKKVKTVRKGRITAPVKLTGLPKGRFTVRISAKTRSGKTVTGVRRYKTCAPKERGGTPPL
jgi:hypothetical protein